MSLKSPRRRAPYPPVIHRREAAAVVRSYSKQIAQWQVRISYLRGLAPRARGPAHRQELLDEVAALMGQVAERQAALADNVAGLTLEVATNARIKDTKRAFESAAFALDGVRAILDGPPTGFSN